MKVTLNWLKQYVEFQWSAEEVAERLTMLGIEVEGVVKIGGEFQGIVVAQVISKDKHPNADKLSLCRVNDGQGERQIVCGAHNFKAGDKVPLILPRASLPAKPGQEPFTIKVGKIRGVESQGMMCSPQELGLPDVVDGLLILRDDAKVGQSFAEYLGRGGTDVIYDLEITPNRPDLNSVIGIAREIAAITGSPLSLPKVSEIAGADSSADKAENCVVVRLEDSELCPRYTARVIKGVKIGPSPDWLRNSLEKIGIRSINNVVDVTNYVMLETGQPLHAFDYHLIAKAEGKDARPAIVVRRAHEAERFVTLDGQERKLTADMLLIADELKPIALAGIMGGQNTEINANTVDVLLESAYFQPQSIRATSKKLELRSESSYRFERGGDIGICDWASRRAAELFVQTAGGTIVPGAVDAYPSPVEPKQITLRHQKVKDLLGINLSSEQIDGYLSQLDLKVAGRKPKPVGASASTSEPVAFKIPTYRVDLKGEIDLIEEVARLYGVDRIPATPPRGAIGTNSYDSVHDEFNEARRILTGLGLDEAQGQTLISQATATFVAPSLVGLANPLSSDMNVLRPSLLPGLLDVLRHNISRKNYEVSVFELGKVFSPSNMTAVEKSPKANGEGAGQVREQRRIAFALTGNRNALFWSGADRDAKFEAYDAKGILEEFFDQYGLRGITYVRQNEPTSLFIEFARIQLGKFEVGVLGQLQPALARKYDLRDPVLLAELDLDVLRARRNASKSFKSLPAFPAIRRDVAMLVPETTTHESVLQIVKQTKPANLESVELFDVFRGQNVPAGQKSLAYAFTYRGADKTLTDAEANTAHDRVVQELKAKLQAIVRE